MRHIKVTIYMFLLILLGSGSAFAVPMIYEFSGEIDAVWETDGIIAAAGVGVGDTVTYTILVDTERVGTRTLQSGEVEIISDSFYADYVSGSVLDETAGGLHGALACNNLGGLFFINTEIIVGTWDNAIGFFSPLSIEDWIVGTSVSVNEIAFSGNTGGIARIRSNVAIVSIERGPEPVPEPSTIILFGSAIAGLIGLGPRKKEEMGPGRNRVTS